MSQPKKQEHHIRVYKMMAQTVGLIACLVFLLFMLGEELPAMIKRDAGELAIFLPIMALPIAGFLITWYQEQLGTFLLITGGLALMAYFFVNGSVGMALVYGLMFLIAGSLFILHIKKKKALQLKK